MNTITRVEKPLSNKCRWVGRPYLLSYVAVYKKRLVLTIVTIGLFWYLDFVIFLPTIIWMGLYVFMILSDIFEYYNLSYYITDKYLIVRKFSKYYGCLINDVSIQDIRIEKNILDLFIGTGTLRYSNLQFSQVINLGMNNRFLGCFYSIKDYQSVIELIEEIKSN